MLKYLVGFALPVILVGCGGSSDSTNESPMVNEPPAADAASNDSAPTDSAPTDSTPPDTSPSDMETLPAALSGRCGPPAEDLDLASSVARYCVTFEALWIMEHFGSVPSSAHFTQIAAAAVNETSTLWRRGELASPGTELLAETGITSDFQDEIRAEIDLNRAMNLTLASGTGATGESTFEIEIPRTFPMLTFATMLAPSPDWFVGLSQQALLTDDGEWVSAQSMDLPVYDAGTESGTTFSLSGTATNPAQPIGRLSETVEGRLNFEEGLLNTRAIATVRLERIQ